MFIKLNHIYKQFGGHVIFDGLNFDVRQGEMKEIAGKSGCGKSTLLNMIRLLEAPDSGEIIFDGVHAPRINSRKATLIQREEIGYLFQNDALVDNMTVDKNLDVVLAYVKKVKKN